VPGAFHLGAYSGKWQPTNCVTNLKRRPTVQKDESANCVPSEKRREPIFHSKSCWETHFLLQQSLCLAYTKRGTHHCDKNFCFRRCFQLELYGDLYNILQARYHLSFQLESLLFEHNLSCARTYVNLSVIIFGCLALIRHHRVDHRHGDSGEMRFIYFQTTVLRHVETLQGWQTKSPYYSPLLHVEQYWVSSARKCCWSLRGNANYIHFSQADWSRKLLRLPMTFWPIVK